MKSTNGLKWTYQPDEHGGLWVLSTKTQTLATDTTGQDGFSMMGWPGEPYVKVKEVIKK